MVSSIDIKGLNLEELLGVVSIYPWYAGARKELCARMAAEGTLSRQQLAQASLYIGSRRILHALVRRNVSADYSDTEVRTQVKTVIEAPREPDPGRIFVVGGDYFSSAQYREVRREDDSIFSSLLRRSVRTCSSKCRKTISISAPKLWLKSTPNRAIWMRQSKFIPN